MNLNKILKKVSSFRESTLIIVIIAICFLMSFVSRDFFGFENIISIFMGLSVNGIIVIGMVILLVSGGFDLSVGAILCFSGVVTGLLLQTGLPIFACIILGILASAAIGLINGFLIAKIKINPFIETLGMMMALNGLVLVIAHGESIQNLPNGFNMIGQGMLFKIQYPIYILIVLTIIGDFLLRNVRFMRQNYYIGENENAARLNGINVSAMKMFNYCLSGALSGIAGILLAARFGGASLSVGQNTALTVITGAIIGGANLSGGEGTVFGAFLGALFMEILANALNLLGVNVYWQNLVAGLILILAVIFDVVNQSRKTKEITTKS
jgi:ribose transport system permease protein